jgi:uncharacterized protein YfiM (DUF2279 family)
VVVTAFPGTRRAPSRQGEIILTGFFAAPAEKDSGSQGEWFGLFNRAADTLNLAGCRLARDRGFGSTRSYAFDSALALGPGAGMTFGRSAATVDVHYADFSLVNTSSPLLLRYGTASGDTLLPMKEGWVTRLGMESLSRRSAPGSWCLARPESAGPGEWGECAAGGP